MKGYKIDFTTNTIVMNYKFAAASKEYGTPEYKLVKDILADFPTMKTVVKAGREIKSARPNKRLTYANMEKHISAYANADELQLIFETVKTLSKPLSSPYKYVSDWFVAQFPNYKELPVFENGKMHVLPIPAPETKKYDFKQAEVA